MTHGDAVRLIDIAKDFVQAVWLFVVIFAFKSFHSEK